MANFKTAEQISKKVGALKYFKNILAKADKEGKAVIKLNCTGASFPFSKGDVVYLKVQTMIAQLTEEIASYDIVQKVSTNQQPIRVAKRTAPAPIGAAPTEEERKAKLREKQREYQRTYNQKLKRLGVKRMSDLPTP